MSNKCSLVDIFVVTVTIITRVAATAVNKATFHGLDAAYSSATPKYKA
jgi:hypothetical protein